MKKKTEPQGNYSTNKDCEWCQGRGFISVPDLKQVWSLGLYERIMQIGWLFAPQRSMYCHLCYPETPKAHNGKPYMNLLDFISETRFNDNEDLFLIRHCLDWHLKARLDSDTVNRLLSSVLDAGRDND